MGEYTRSYVESSRFGTLAGVDVVSESSAFSFFLSFKFQLTEPPLLSLPSPPSPDLACPTASSISDLSLSLAASRALNRRVSENRIQPDALLIALVSILYFAVSRVFAPSHVARLTGRAQWYLTGVAVASNPANSTSWPQL